MGDKREMPHVEKSKGNRLSSWLRAVFCGALAGFVICGAETAAAAIGDASDLSNIPMEAQQKSAPANIMYIFDDSGSMHSDWVMSGWDDRAWSYANHDHNTLYYNPNLRYSPWPWPGRPGAATPEARTLDRIPLAQITTAPRWPIIPAELSGCQAAPLNPTRTVGYFMYGSNESGVNTGQNTRDLTAQVTAYDVASMPAAASIELPATHYFVYRDINGDGKGDGYQGTEIDAGELWLVVLLYNNGTPQRRYYEVADLDGDGMITDGELILRDEATIPPEVLAWLKPHWTAADGSVTEPTPAQELENFLQWYVYYSTSNFSAMNAVAVSLTSLSGANVGMYSINSETNTWPGSSPKLRIGVMPVKVGSEDNTDYLLCRLYNFYSENGNTPFVDAYDKVGRYFTTADDGGFTPVEGKAKPFNSAADGGTCQQSFIINFTDGYFAGYGNATYPAADQRPVGDLDGDGSANTIADFAKFFYDNDLAPDLADDVPITVRDSNNKQHIVTYSVAFGVTGAIPAQQYIDYVNDPYFEHHGQPDWNTGDTVDQLWHASVIGTGIYYNASNAQQLADSLKAIAVNISSRQAVGAAAAVNSSGQLNDDTTLYVGRYSVADWTGQLFAYPISKVTGKVDTAAERWEAASKLKARDPNNRLIFTSDGNKTHGVGTSDTGKALPFTWAGLNDAAFTGAQREMLGYTASNTGAFADNINYIRGKNNIPGLRVRGGDSTINNVLGDIIHSSPVLVRAAAMGNPDRTIGTVYVGANDGMLHAFDVKTGEERFAFIPSQVHDHLLALSTSDYLDKHRYYVDATPVVGRITFFKDDNGDSIADQPVTRTRDMQLLVSGLGRGGRGYFALDVAGADTIDASTPILNVTPMLQWEYPTRQMIDTPSVNVTDQPITDYTTTGACTYKLPDLNNNNPDNDGELKCANGAGTQVLAYRDKDLGYSYSAPVIFPSKNRNTLGLRLPTTTTQHPWVVVFGNGYGSENGEAILYVLDAISGKLIKKIGTGSRPSGANPLKNGLSSPAAISVEGDDQVDFVYAGDLYGNLWKFDFRSKDPNEWRVAYEDSGGNPQPLFTTMQGGQPGQPITSRPDVVLHNKKTGYIIVFGTGQFLGSGDFADTTTQSLFGIWDNDSTLATSDHIDNDNDGRIDERNEAILDRRKYLGAWNRTANSFPEASKFLGATLLKQDVIFQGQACDDSSNCPTVRVTSDYDPQWFNSSDSAYRHVGWYLDLPGLGNIAFGAPQPAAPSANPSERVVDDVRIRYGKLLAMSFIPEDQKCVAGGKSVLMELSAFTGARLNQPQFDLGSGKLDASDYVYLAGIGYVAPSGLFLEGKSAMPTITGGTDGSDGTTENKYMPSSTGAIQNIVEARGGNPGILFWREATQN